MQRKHLISVILAILCIPAVISASVYTWTDSDGVKHFSQEPPPEGATNVAIEEEIKHDPSAEAKGFSRSSASDTSSSAPGQSSSTRILVEGNTDFVPVVLDYDKYQVKTLLVLDTGASSTVITIPLAERLGIQPTPTTTVEVAGGKSIKAQDITLDALRVGPHTLRNVRALIIRHKGAHSSVQGFLGMDFLGQFPFSIDLQNNRIHWKSENPATSP